MRVFTTCDVCGHNIVADVSHKEAGAELGKMQLAAKIKCERCEGYRDWKQIGRAHV